MLDPVIIPPPDAIEQWQDLGDVPILETVSRSVPVTQYVRYPDESLYQRIISIKANLPASTDIATIRDIDQNIDIIDKHLGDLYSRRSLTIPLFKYMEELKKQQGTTMTPQEFSTDEAKSIAASFVIPQIEFYNQERQDCIQINNSIKNILLSQQSWDIESKSDRFASGHYSDILLEHLCLLIFKLSCLEQLNPAKSAIATDITQFLMIAKDQISQEVQRQNMEIRMWILSKNSITNELLNALKDTPHEKTKLIYKIFTQFLRRRLEEDDSIHPDSKYIYVNAFLFFCRFYEHQRLIELKDFETKRVKKPKPILKPISDDDRAFYKAMIETYPIMLYIFELSTATTDLIIPDLLTLSKKKKVINPPKIPNLPLDVQIGKLRRNFDGLSHNLNLIHSTCSDGPTLRAGTYLIRAIPKTLHDIGRALNTIRLMLSQVLTKTPNQPEDDDRDLLPYEKSMLFGLKDSLNVILLTLSICRTTKELLEDFFPLINQNITFFVQHTIQDFARNKLAVAIARNNQHKDSLVLIFNELRVLLGYIKDSSELNTTETNPKKLPKLDLTFPECGPNLSLLELMLSQLQFLINPESEFVTKQSLLGSAPLDSEDQKEIQEFLKTARHFIPLMQLSDTLNVVCDQSRLFFREYFLDANKVTFFRVTTSLPMVLSDYALKNYTKPELTGSIFYPLSIYDDAAAVALKYLHSRYLYDEIKAEGNICLQSIIQLITDSAFHPIRKYASLRSLPLTLMETISKKFATKGFLDEESSALRLGVILSQNSLYLLGCHVQTKGLIGNRLNKIFDDELTKIFNSLLDKHGIITSIAVHHLFQMLKKTHQLLHGFGLPLIPFEDILSHVFATDTPNSLQSLLLATITENLLGTVLPDYALISNPIRLVPKKAIQVDIAGLHVGPVGDILKYILEPTCKFISLENFRELFWYMDDGAINLLADQVIGEIPEIWDELINIHRGVHANLIRISNPPISMTVSQVYDRFEGAYRNFLQDNSIKNLLQTMGQIGNAIAVLQLMDMAFLLKQNTEQQLTTFFLSKNPFASQIEKNEQKSNIPELFNEFDKDFQSTYSYFQGMNTDAEEGQALAPKLYRALEVISALTKANPEFDETSSTMLDLTTLTGFEATWSVLEFVLTLFELSAENHDNPSSRFGEGVQLCAAAILCAEGQQEMHRPLSIGERVRRHNEMDFANNEDPRIKSFLHVDTMFQASLKCAMCQFVPYFNRIEANQN